MTRKLPTGTLTFFFTDIEGSTQLARRLGSGFKDVLNAHNGIVRSAIADIDDGAVEAAVSLALNPEVG